MNTVTINGNAYEPFPKIDFLPVEVPDDITRLVKVSGTPWGYFNLNLTPEEAERVFYAWGWNAGIGIETV